MEAAQREADNIMAIAFLSGPEPPLAKINTVTTQTAQSVPPTAPAAGTATTATDCLDHGRQPRLTSPAFMMNTIPDNQPGPTTEPDKQFNARLVEIANQGPPLETTATSHPDCPIPDRRQYTNHGEHQYHSMYTNQNRSYNSNYN